MKVKKRFIFYISILLILISTVTIWIQLKPIFTIKTKNYYHQNIIQEINTIITEIEVPQSFILNNENTKSINTNLLNHWIKDINEHFLKSIENIGEASIPIGYFTGIYFIQTSGPKLNFKYLIENRTLCSYDIKTTSLGINNVLIELILNIECNGNIFIGFERNELNIQHTIPIALEYVEGNVPQFFPYEKK